MKQTLFGIRNLHLWISAVVLIPVALIYGLHPDAFWKDILGLDISNVDLRNIFKAIMGVYLCFAALFIAGIMRPSLWFTATVSSILLMGGLALGRLVSMVTDGIPSKFYFVGCFLELLLCLLAAYNLQREGRSVANSDHK
jgi:hypothetical protein